MSLVHYITLVLIIIGGISCAKREPVKGAKKNDQTKVEKEDKEDKEVRDSLASQEAARKRRELEAQRIQQQREKEEEAKRRLAEQPPEKPEEKPEEKPPLPTYEPPTASPDSKKRDQTEDMVKIGLVFGKYFETPRLNYGLACPQLAGLRHVHQGQLVEAITLPGRPIFYSVSCDYLIAKGQLKDTPVAGFYSAVVEPVDGLWCPRDAEYLYSNRGTNRGAKCLAIARLVSL